MQVNLDLSQVNGELSQFQTVPTGTYDFTVKNAEWRETAAKNGSFYAVTLQVVGGTHAGKAFNQNFTIANQNEKAVKIGLENIKQILTQIEHPNPNLLGNLNELINGKTFRGIVELEAFQTKEGNTGYSSSLKKIVSKEVSLVDGEDTPLETKTKPAALKPSIPAAAPAAAPPSSAPAPVAPPAPAAAPVPANAPWLKK